MNLSSADWLIIILLAVGVVILLVGLIGRVRWRIALVGGLLTAIAVFLLVQAVTEETSPSPSPSAPPSPFATSAPAAGASSPAPSAATTP